MNQKGFTNITLVLIIIVLAGAASYFILIRRPETSLSPQPQQPTNQVQLPSSDNTAIPLNGKVILHRNTKLGFELSLPQGWESTDQNEDNARVWYNCSSNSCEMQVEIMAVDYLIKDGYDETFSEYQSDALEPQKLDNLIVGARVIKHKPLRATGWKYNYSVFFEKEMKGFYIGIENGTEEQLILPSFKLLIKPRP